MHRLFAIAALILVSPSAAAAQGSREEREFRSFLAQYDKAVAGRDVAFLERAIPTDFVFTGASGRLSDRARTLKFFTAERDKPSYRMISLKHENVVVRVIGNTAVVTNDYTAQWTALDAPDAEPNSDKGRHTGVFAKRDGHWVVIAEQDTEQIHDDRLMERQVLAAARDYHELMKRGPSGRGDTVALAALLEDDYTGTSRDGATANRVQALAEYQTSQVTIESAELSDQKVLAVDNGTVVETGQIRNVGTRAGSRFDETTRYTTTWVLRGRWQIRAAHSSMVRPKE